MSAPALSLQGVTKTFNGLRAVDDLSLTVRPGEVYGFLGPNGAGKTTTIKMILGLAYPDAGRVFIGGRDLAEAPHEVKRTLGFLPERVAFYENLTALQNLEFFARLKGNSPDGLEAMLTSVGLGNFVHTHVRTFSRGMIQLLGVAQALLGSPRLLLLDEPTTGLDPNWSRAVKDRIREANRGGATVFFSSHLLSEVQELADRVGILQRGKLLAEDTVANLGQALEMKPRLRLSVDMDVERAQEALSSVEGVESVEADRGQLVVTCDPKAKSRVLRRLEDAGVEVHDFRTEEPSLEEVFLRYTRDGEGSVR